MLRFKVLVPALPLIAAAVIARLELAPSPQPCIAVGGDSVALGSGPYPADLHVDFTDDPALATVRVGLAESPETADLVVVDDSAASDDVGCSVTAATQVVAIAADPSHLAPRIYLAEGRAAAGSADYRIFVRSSRVTAKQAAALLVGAHAREPHPVDAIL
jgi:hypothetical protein